MLVIASAVVWPAGAGALSDSGRSERHFRWPRLAAATVFLAVFAVCSVKNYTVLSVVVFLFCFLNDDAKFPQLYYYYYYYIILYTVLGRLLWKCNRLQITSYPT